MTRYPIWRVVIVLTLTLALTGCTGTVKAPTTPAAPANPPQVQVLNYARLAAAADNTAARALTTLCISKPPVIDIVTCNVVKDDLKTIVDLVDQITAEANRVPDLETWSAARKNIAVIGAKAVIHSVVSDPGLQSDLTSLALLIQQIKGVQ